MAGPGVGPVTRLLQIGLLGALLLLPARPFALPLKLAPGQRVQVPIRLASQDGLYEAMPSTLFTQAAFNANLERQDLVLSLNHGGRLALALYQLLLFIATRERAFGLYVGYMVSLLAWNLLFQSDAFRHGWPEATACNNNVLTVAAAWAFGFFTVEYLQLRHAAPHGLRRTVQALARANMVFVLPAAMDFYALGAGIGDVTGVALAAVALGAGFWLQAKGQRQARIFVLALTDELTGTFNRRRLDEVCEALYAAKSQGRHGVASARRAKL